MKQLENIREYRFSKSLILFFFGFIDLLVLIACINQPEFIIQLFNGNTEMPIVLRIFIITFLSGLFILPIFLYFYNKPVAYINEEYFCFGNKKMRLSDIEKLYAGELKLSKNTMDAFYVKLKDSKNEKVFGINFISVDKDDFNIVAKELLFRAKKHNS